MVGLAAVLVLAGAAAGVVAWRASQRRPTSTALPSVATTTVRRANLSTSQTVSGTLGTGTPVPVNGNGGGIITWLPGSGADVSRGQPLYRVDNRPVPLLYGHIPLYRTLNAEGMVGPDVAMIASNLTALGYDIGYQPPVGSVITQSAGAPATASSPSYDGGKTPSEPATPRVRASAPPVTTTVERGDATLTPGLIDAVQSWQAAEGMSPTGVLGPGAVVVQPGAVEVGSVQSQPGSPASGPLLSVTSEAKIVTIAADSVNVPSLRASQSVTIALPDNSTTPGTIAAVSGVVQSAQTSSDGEPQQTLTVSLDHPGAAAGFTAASVQVTFTGTTERGVLAVPVGALLALTGGGYGLQLPSGRLLPVHTGMFAQGLVQVSGPGISGGLRVVTAG
jgi:hypothetical protein